MGAALQQLLNIEQDPFIGELFVAALIGHHLQKPRSLFEAGMQAINAFQGCLQFRSLLTELTRALKLPPNTGGGKSFDDLGQACPLGFVVEGGGELGQAAVELFGFLNLGRYQH